MIIGTHDGTFHCDESLAVAMLKMTNEFKNAVVVRTRNPDLLAKCNIVVDVGARYEPEVSYTHTHTPQPTTPHHPHTTQNNLLDHHQKEFQETMNTGIKQYKTRLSSAGLVYLHYGREVLRKFAPDVSDADLERLYDKVYENFMEHVDGIDNGVQQYSAADANVAVVQNYRVSTSLSARVSNLSPRWNQKADPESFNEGFVKAVALTGQEFEESVSFFADAWLPAANIVVETLQKRFDVHESGKIIRLDTFCPWQEHLFDVERSQNVAGEILYCLFPDMNRGWRVCGCFFCFVLFSRFFFLFLFVNCLLPLFVYASVHQRPRRCAPWVSRAPLSTRGSLSRGRDCVTRRCARRRAFRGACSSTPRVCVCLLSAYCRRIHNTS